MHPGSPTPLLILFLFLLPLARVEAQSSAPTQKPAKYALLIGIGDYNSAKTGWHALSSVNDLALIRSSLISIGFPNANIMQIKNDSATRIGIRESFEKLIARVNTGDMVIIHYSGHGTQVSDVNHDESDGLDEAMVPIDAPSSTVIKYNKYKGFKNGIVNYDGSLHFLDDELGSLITRLRLKVGKEGHVVVFLDSCHSGTGSRGAIVTRGGGDPIILANVPAKSSKDNDKGFGLFSEKTIAVDQSKIGKFILITGASSDESNAQYPDKPIGSLTYAISKALESLKAKETYAILFAEIQSTMAAIVPRQTPTIEGDVDFEFLGNQYHVKDPYFRVLNKADLKNNTSRPIFRDSIAAITIDAGSVNGVEIGSKICLSPAGNDSSSKNCTITGEVVASDALTSTVKLKSPLFFNKETDYWVYVTAYALRTNRIKVSLAGIKDPKLKEAFTQEIKKVGLVNLSEDKPDLAVKESLIKNKKYLCLVNASFENTINQFDLRTQEEAIRGIKSTIKNYILGQFISQMDTKDPQVDVRVKLIPFDTLTQKELDINPFMVSGNLEFPTGQVIRMELANMGSISAFYNVIEIMENGTIQAMHPTRNMNDPNAWYLAPGAKYNDIYFAAGSTSKGEIIKVISSSSPFNICRVIENPGVGRKGGPLSNLENLFAESDDDMPQSRGDAPKASTYNLMFKIVSKK